MSVRCRSASQKPSALAILLAAAVAMGGVACGSATLKSTDGGAGASGKAGAGGIAGATGQGGGAGGLAGAGGGAAGPACVLDSTQVDNCTLK